MKKKDSNKKKMVKNIFFSFLFLNSCSSIPFDQKKEFLIKKTYDLQTLEDFFPEMSGLTKEQRDSLQEDHHFDDSSEQIFALAQNSLKLKSLEKSKIYFISLLSDPSFKDVSLLGLAIIAIKDNDLEKAQEYLSSMDEKIEKQKFLKILQMYLFAIIQEKKGERLESRKIFREIILYEKKFFYGYIALAGSYIKDQKYDTAQFIILRAMDDIGERKELFSMMGYILLLKEEFDTARHYFNKSLSLDPFFGMSYLYRGYLSILESDKNSAKQDLSKGLELLPHFYQSFILLSLMFQLDPSDPIQAESALRESLLLDPFSQESRIFLSNFLLKNAETKEEALRLKREALTLPR